MNIGGVTERFQEELIFSSGFFIILCNVVYSMIYETFSEK